MWWREGKDGRLDKFGVDNMCIKTMGMEETILGVNCGVAKWTKGLHGYIIWLKSV